MKKNNVLIFTIGITAILVGGCTLSASQINVEPPSDAVYTVAAETIIAQYTQDAHPTSEKSNEPQESPVDASSGDAIIGETPEVEETEIAPTQTETQEPSPTMTLTNSPTVKVEQEPIWEDDFSNQTLWYTDDGEDFGFKYQDEGYIIYNDLLNAAIWSIGYEGLNNIRIEIDMSRLEGPDDGYYGVFCRHTNEGKNYYGLVIGDDGFYGIMKMVEGEIEFIESGIDDKQIINRGKGEINNIQGICSGSKLSLIVNDSVILEVNDDTYTIGASGLLAANKLSGVGIEVLFDNFAIYEE